MSANAREPAPQCARTVATSAARNSAGARAAPSTHAPKMASRRTRPGSVVASTTPMAAPADAEAVVPDHRVVLGERGEERRELRAGPVELEMPDPRAGHHERWAAADGAVRDAVGSDLAEPDLLLARRGHAQQAT